MTSKQFQASPSNSKLYLQRQSQKRYICRRLWPRVNIQVQILNPRFSSRNLLMNLVKVPRPSKILSCYDNSLECVINTHMCLHCWLSTWLHAKTTSLIAFRCRFEAAYIIVQVALSKRDWYFYKMIESTKLKHSLRRMNYCIRLMHMFIYPI